MTAPTSCSRVMMAKACTHKHISSTHLYTMNMKPPHHPNGIIPLRTDFVAYQKESLEATEALGLHSERRRKAHMKGNHLLQLSPAKAERLHD